MDPNNPSFVHDAEHSVFGTFDETTAWRLVPFKHGLSLFGFEDIAGNPVPVPDNVMLRCLDKALTDLMPHGSRQAPKIGEQFVVQRGASYDLALTTSSGVVLRTLFHINNKQYHEVRAWVPDSKLRVVRSDKVK